MKKGHNRRVGSIGGQPKLSKTYDQRSAHMAEQAYGEEGGRKQNVGGFVLDNELSNKRTAVYHRKAGNGKKARTVMALRGTDFKSAKDLYSDGHIVMGTQRNSHEFRQDKKNFKRIQKKYGGRDKHSIEAVGHSLGANRASALTRSQGIRSTGFNKGQSLLDKTSILDKARCKLPKALRPKGCGKSKQHLIGGDPLSSSERVVGQSNQNTVHKADKGQSYAAQHSMSNFTKDLSADAPVNGLRRARKEATTYRSATAGRAKRRHTDPARDPEPERRTCSGGKQSVVRHLRPGGGPWPGKTGKEGPPRVGLVVSYCRKRQGVPAGNPVVAAAPKTPPQKKKAPTPPTAPPKKEEIKT